MLRQSGAVEPKFLDSRSHSNKICKNVGLLQIGVDAGLVTSLYVLLQLGRGHDYDGNVLQVRIGFYFSERLPAVFARHIQIQQDK